MWCLAESESDVCTSLTLNLSSSEFGASGTGFGLCPSFVLCGSRPLVTQSGANHSSMSMSWFYCIGRAWDSVSEMLPVYYNGRRVVVTTVTLF